MPIVHYLLNIGASAVKLHRDGFSALFVACANKNTEMMHLLAAKGANVNEVNGQGQTLLMQALNEGSFRTATALILKGAKLDVRDKEGRDVYMVACEQIVHYMGLGGSEAVKGYGSIGLMLLKTPPEQLVAALRTSDYFDLCQRLLVCSKEKQQAFCIMQTVHRPFRLKCAQNKKIPRLYLLCYPATSPV